MPEPLKESYCFVALNLAQCGIKDDDPVLAYDCRIVSNTGESAQETVMVRVQLIDGDGARRRKVAEAISLHFRDRFNLSGSTVIFP
jgi:hypothetical protein